jgi:cytochrome P450
MHTTTPFPEAALTQAALRDYEPRVEQFTQQLMSVLKDKEGLPVDVSTLFNFYSFDVMGDLAFDSGFDMLKDGIVHYYMESVHSNMLAVSAFSHLVWIFPLLKAIPIVNNEHIKFQSWLKSSVDERVKVDYQSPSDEMQFTDLLLEKAREAGPVLLDPGRLQCNQEANEAESN